MTEKRNRSSRIPFKKVKVEHVTDPEELAKMDRIRAEAMKYRPEHPDELRDQLDVFEAKIDNAEQLNRQLYREIETLKERLQQRTQQKETIQRAYQELLNVIDQSDLANGLREKLAQVREQHQIDSGNNG